MSDVKRVVLDLISKIENDNPLNRLNEKEFDDCLLKYGSLLSIINNKSLNPTNIFLLIVKEKEYERVFSEFSGIPDLFNIMKMIISRYPNLIKSKMVAETAKKYFKKRQKNGH